MADDVRGGYSAPNSAGGNARAVVQQNLHNATAAAKQQTRTLTDFLLCRRPYTPEVGVWHMVRVVGANVALAAAVVQGLASMGVFNGKTGDFYEALIVAGFFWNARTMMSGDMPSVVRIVDILILTLLTAQAAPRVRVDEAVPNVDVSFTTTAATSTARKEVTDGCPSNAEIAAYYEAVFAKPASRLVASDLAPINADGQWVNCNTGVPLTAQQAQWCADPEGIIKMIQEGRKTKGGNDLTAEVAVRACQRSGI